MDEIALLDEAMLAWFPPSGTVELSTRSTFTETDLRGISHLLHQSGKPSWSRIPRIYTTLRLINELDVIDAFLDRGITDLSLPFNQRTLPGLLKDQSSRVRFLDVQSRVLTKALDLEKEKSKHRHFSNPDDLPFKKVAELGKGGYGFVDKVLSTVSYREYALMLVSSWNLSPIATLKFY
ncbi:hypothetical protein ACET3X_002017 [Alternaria dauci]|uniref:Uncharacterized protein n=1 Tax=Alternaria dauci TaxID=48095 RepID=A0ABR3UZ02_9PLEO